MVNAPAPARRTAPRITVIDGQPTTTSRDIAETFGKAHRNVLARIESLDCSPEFRVLNFKQASYQVEGGQGATGIYTEYRITRDGFAFLCMGFTGAKAAQWKERYIDTFNQMAEKLAAAPALPAPRRNRNPDHQGKLLPLPGVILEPARSMLDAAVWRLTGQVREQIADWAARRLAHSCRVDVADDLQRRAEGVIDALNLDDFLTCGEASRAAVLLTLAETMAFAATEQAERLRKTLASLPSQDGPAASAAGPKAMMTKAKEIAQK